MKTSIFSVVAFLLQKLAAKDLPVMWVIFNALLITCWHDVLIQPHEDDCGASPYSQSERVRSRPRYLSLCFTRYIQIHIQIYIVLYTHSDMPFY